MREGELPGRQPSPLQQTSLATGHQEPSVCFEMNGRDLVYLCDVLHVHKSNSSKGEREGLPRCVSSSGTISHEGSYVATTSPL
ncbi:hypothetical protein AAC387_Pa03g4020 [Persea americana]